MLSGRLPPAKLTIEDTPLSPLSDVTARSVRRSTPRDSGDGQTLGSFVSVVLVHTEKVRIKSEKPPKSFCWSARCLHSVVVKLTFGEVAAADL
jgi:hypothetical protein